MAGRSEVFANLAQRLKNPTAQRSIGLGILVLACCAFAGYWFLGHHNNDAAPVAAVNSGTRHTAPTPGHPHGMDVAAASAANSGHPAVREVAPPQAGAAARTKGSMNANQAASATGTESPVVTAVPQNAASAGSPQAHLDDHLTYQYNALGRRDPFQSLVDGPFVGVDVGGDAPPDPGGIKVVGIVWGASDQFALVEDVRGNSFVLRKGDKVQNGVVEGLKRDGVIVSITAEGQSQSVVIPLVRKGDQNAR